MFTPFLFIKEPSLDSIPEDTKISTESNFIADFFDFFNKFNFG